MSMAVKNELNTGILNLKVFTNFGSVVVIHYT